MTKAKPFDIPKREVWEAFKKVKANQGAAGVDGTGATIGTEAGAGALDSFAINECAASNSNAAGNNIDDFTMEQVYSWPKLKMSVNW